ncbi:MAG: terminase, partial [Bacilli bacterium]|nr:terminase [Bacilli bacterium]
MAKSLLISNFQGYLLASDGSQSKELFQKIEKIAKREIASFTGLTDVFHNELVKSAANTDGFTHNPNSFEYKLYNGSKVNTLNSIPDNLRSKRSNCNFYDEAGYIPDELFVATEPFTAQNSNFSLGGDVDVTTRSKQFPNQLIYASSASSIDTYFYKKYRDFSKRMFLGDRRYFVADIKDEVVMKATYNGKIYPSPLLTQEVIDNAIRDNSERANREYKNIFSKEGGDNQIIKRATIIRNSKLRKPIMYNDYGGNFIL